MRVTRLTREAHIIGDTGVQQLWQENVTAAPPRGTGGELGARYRMPETSTAALVAFTMRPS